jgi:glycosylphosphatidylinositol phospholipase D
LLTTALLQKRVAFIFAIASHDAADVSWHNLRGMSHGFIQEMADVNFHGSYNEAHDAADSGGEFTLSHMTDLGYLTVSIW